MARLVPGEYHFVSTAQVLKSQQLEGLDKLVHVVDILMTPLRSSFSSKFPFFFIFLCSCFSFAFLRLVYNYGVFPDVKVGFCCFTLLYPTQSEVEDIKEILTSSKH